MHTPRVLPALVSTQLFRDKRIRMPGEQKEKRPLFVSDLRMKKDYTVAAAKDSDPKRLRAVSSGPREALLELAEEGRAVRLLPTPGAASGTELEEEGGLATTCRVQMSGRQPAGALGALAEWLGRERGLAVVGNSELHMATVVVTLQEQGCLVTWSEEDEVTAREVLRRLEKNLQ